MKTKSKMLFLGMMAALIFMVCPLFPWMQTEVFAAGASGTTLTVKNKELYDALLYHFQKSAGDNKDALVSKNDGKQEITLNMEKVKSIEIKRVDMTKDNSLEVLKTLINSCDNLEGLYLDRCNLTGFDYNLLNQRKNLSKLYLVNAGMTVVPNLKLEKLSILCLSENNLSANGACDAITRANFPNLQTLWLDDCGLTNIDFIKNTGGGLISLSLGDNRLTDASLSSLLDMSQGTLAGLEDLNLGIKVHDVAGISYNIYSNSKNNFTDMEKLALLPERFPLVKKMDLSALKITSLQAFRGLRDNIYIDFSQNRISDFAGLESKNITLGRQKMYISGNFAPDLECEMPEILKNIMDGNHRLYGTLEKFNNCRLSGDGTKLIFEPKQTRASVSVKGGRLSDSTIYFEPIRLVPAYTIPQGLTATEGDTLAKVILPEGFAWKDSALFVGEVGTRSFKGIYTPKDTGKYISLEVDIPVTVKKAETNSTEVTPGPKPIPDPSPEPDEPDKPDESNLTGNQIEARKDLSLLLATGKQKGKNGIELTWKKKNGSSGYEVYWSYCDGKRNYQKAKTVKSTGRRSYIHKNLKKSRAYKYYIVSYKIKGGKKFYQSKSPVIHVAMSQEKSTNVKSITVNKTKVSLKAKKTFQIKASAKAENKKKKLLAHTDKFRYYTNDKKVAEVTRKGKIRAKKKGSCSIFVIANNGVSKEIKVTVK